jgi:hypothetical protein
MKKLKVTYQSGVIDYCDLNERAYDKMGFLGAHSPAGYIDKAIKFEILDDIQNSARIELEVPFYEPDIAMQWTVKEFNLDNKIEFDDFEQLLYLLNLRRFSYKVAYFKK